MIKAGGIWVSPTEVEARIVQHESVAECAVVGHRDADGLEEVVACVVPHARHRRWTATSSSRSAGRAWPRSSGPGRSWCWRACRRPRPAKIQRVVVREIAADALRK